MWFFLFQGIPSDGTIFMNNDLGWGSSSVTGFPLMAQQVNHIPVLSLPYHCISVYVYTRTAHFHFFSSLSRRRVTTKLRYYKCSWSETVAVSPLWVSSKANLTQYLIHSCTRYVLVDEVECWAFSDVVFLPGPDGRTCGVKPSKYKPVIVNRGLVFSCHAGK